MMRLQDQIVRQTQRALEEVLRAFEALPEDKRDWKPAEHSRSAMSQLQEIAVVPVFHEMLLQGSGLPDGFHRDLQARAAALTSFDECRSEAVRATAALCGAIASFPDERLDEEVTLPFGPGMTMTMADVLTQHHWNMVYHLGQINYIQTMLGDREMH